MTTIDNITDEQIEALCGEAEAAGDDEMAAICERAIDGDPDATEACVQAINATAAMGDDR